MDHFEVFGLPRRLGIDLAQLQRKFYELSRQSHPDFHQAAPAERQAKILESAGGLNTPLHAPPRQSHPDSHQPAPAERQAEILEASARLNAAYRALRDPIARIEYLVRLEGGRDTREGARGEPNAAPAPAERV